MTRYCLKRKRLDIDTEPEKEPYDKYDSDDESSSGLYMYWHDSSDEDVSDSGEEESGDEGWDSESAEELNPTSSFENLNTTQLTRLECDKFAEARLCRAWGTGSQKTMERKLHDARQFQRQASQIYINRAMFQKAREKVARPEPPEPLGARRTQNVHLRQVQGRKTIVDHKRAHLGSFQKKLE